MTELGFLSPPSLFENDFRLIGDITRLDALGEPAGLETILVPGEVVGAALLNDPRLPSRSLANSTAAHVHLARAIYDHTLRSRVGIANEQQHRRIIEFLTAAQLVERTEVVEYSKRIVLVSATKLLGNAALLNTQYPELATHINLAASQYPPRQKRR